MENKKQGTVNGITPTRITQDTFKQVLSKLSPSEFVGMPNKTQLNVGGIKFNYLWTNTITNSKGNKVYVHDYQSEKKDSRGNYVLATVKVEERRTKKYTKYNFDTSSIGSRLY